MVKSMNRLFVLRDRKKDICNVYFEHSKKDAVTCSSRSYFTAIEGSARWQNKWPVPASTWVVYHLVILPNGILLLSICTKFCIPGQPTLHPRQRGGFTLSTPINKNIFAMCVVPCDPGDEVVFLAGQSKCRCLGVLCFLWNKKFRCFIWNHHNIK